MDEPTQRLKADTISQYWAIPPNSKQCSAATNHLITNAVFNISSDLIILSIPMPLLFRVRLPKKNKAILFSVFLIGAFTYVDLDACLPAANSNSIVAAVLNKYYSFTNPFGTEWTKWYLRESYTALLCANLPLIYPLIQKVFKLRNWNSETYSTDSGYPIHSGPSRTARSTHATRNGQWPKPAHKSTRGTVRRTESQEIMGIGYSVDDDGPQFITSAIDMDNMKSPAISSLATPPGWKPGEDSKKESEIYHAV